MVQATLAGATLGNNDIRPLVRLKTCATDLAPADVSIDRIEFLRDNDNDGLADINADGIVDPGESDPSNPDTDGDGNFCDATLNNDGFVTVVDYLILRSKLNQTPETSGLIP